MSDKQTRVRRFAQFRSEAGKSNPYRLQLDDDQVVEIAPLTTGQLLELAECGDQPKKALRVLCGEQFDRVWEAVSAEPIEVFNALFSDIAQHFGMGSAPLDSGTS
ncbi:hypothetical protein [Saccharopolyspora rosea]|uniref:Tail assembly chaperone n=1 Tax=Saccharopolyspora rosea TaxID=524884 RepID=A0ABW3FNQ9_9PSEU|nr:hypothetical protein [Saccharopolyspora rosea]